MKNKGTVLVATPVQQHSFQLAGALKKAGLLQKYCTTVFVKQNSFLWKLIGKVFGKKLQNAIPKKTCAEIEPDTDVVCGIFGLVYYFCCKANEHLSDTVYYHLTRCFGRKIAKKAIKDDVMAVIMFDYTAVAGFEYLKEHAPQITRILDMSSIPAMSINAILDREEENGYIALHKSKRSRYSKRFCQYFATEITDSDFFFVAGDFARSCLIEQGAKPEQCFFVPYGVNTENFCPDYHLPEDGVVNFVYTGRVEAAKGIIYVLEAFKKLFNEGVKFRLHLVGTVHIPKEVLDEYADFCVLHGYLAKEQLVELYHRSQVYVMCSLWEGRSLSIIEALSCGLPSIITTSTGMTDCVTDGENGFVVSPADVDAIYEKAKWFVDNQNCLGKMSKKAVSSIYGMTWDDYDRKVADAIGTMLAERT